MKEELKKFYDEYSKLSYKEIEKFKELTNKLTNVIYLTAYKEIDKNDYYFISTNFDCFYNYFILSGKELINYKSQKTFVLQSPYTPKLSLNKINSIILLLLRLLYNQKLKDISLDMQINITTGDIQEQYEHFANFKNERLKTGELSEGLRLLKRHNIIDFKGDNFQNDDFIITILPTIQYAVGIDDIKTLVDKINSYLEKEEEEEEEYEEIKED